MKHRVFLGFSCLLLLADPAPAQPAPAFHVEASYTGDVFGNLAGGLRRDVVYLDNFDVTLALDLEHLLGWSRTHLFLYGLGNQGGHPSRLAGDAQGVNNIEAPTAWQLYEAWLQHLRDDGRLSVLLGLYDLNTEFDLIRTAALFINSSHGIGPDFSQSGKNGPSIFPHTSVGARVKWLPVDALYVQAVALDGVPGDPARPHGTRIRFGREDGLLLAAETGLFFDGMREGTAPVPRRRVSRLGEPVYRARLGLGAWMYTAAFDVLGRPGEQARSRGAYLLGEWQPYREPGGTGGLAVFVRLGAAHARVNRFGAYLGAGIVYTGPFRGRDDDRLGLALASAYNGTPYRRAQRQAGQPVERAETTFELTYLALFSARLALQADLQYVVNPDTNPARGNALVLGLRFMATL
ncbi:carbohydrate porin [Rhodocaloribacter litoris]|uniref:carbohydrate porin n=1 Tax=Rhodocaloribacter litoris TaxID=2558931 RepID=UPI001423B25F|nr:carbohydrate porin [Rhodocaloribacter litoris]QXD16850.1 carbohydrate porin [Rhodocaloribacter litoris]